jgi:energy-coupling factor transport system substrate-specific component
MRKLLYIAAGSAAYAAVNLLTEHLSFPGLEVVRPGIAVPILCGLLFGPIVGIGVGFLGSTGSDLLTFGFYWNWSLGNGLVGMVAGVGPFLFSRIRRQWLTILTATAVGAVAIVLGAGLAAMTDVFVANLTPDTAISAEGISLATWNLFWGVPLLVVMLAVWAVVRRRATSR